MSIADSCKFTNELHVSPADHTYYLICVVVRACQLIRRSLLQLRGVRHACLTTCHPTSKGRTLHRSALTKNDVLVLFQYEEAVVELQNCRQDMLFQALKSSVRKFPYIHCSFDVISEDGNTYLVAKEKPSGLYVEMGIRTRWTSLLNFIISKALFPFQSAGRRIIFSRLRDSQLFRKVLFYCISAMSTLYLKVEVFPESQKSKLYFRISHLVADGWTQVQFLSSFVHDYQNLTNNARTGQGSTTCSNRNEVLEKCLQIESHLQGIPVWWSAKQDICKIQYGFVYSRMSLFGSWVYPPTAVQYTYTIPLDTCLEHSTSKHISSGENQLWVVAYVFHRAMKFKNKSLTLVSVHRPFLQAQGNLLITTRYNGSQESTICDIFSALRLSTSTIRSIALDTKITSNMLDGCDSKVKYPWIAVVPILPEVPSGNISVSHGRDIPVCNSLTEAEFFRKMTNWVSVHTRSTCVDIHFDLSKPLLDSV
mmetsp:Transcript_1654/g.5753  ORF Transcript_1654/g.5753 Transcript_1654/m.5753 type:complete len:479 (+) Transcript_1654:255-1691(+)